MIIKEIRETLEKSFDLNSFEKDEIETANI